MGVPLGPAAQQLARGRGRGRHGNALQWHFGLEMHDGSATLDWEDRIEIKLVSVWRRGAALGCDKLKVCDLGVDPWHKLSNTLFVFADRLTRVVLGFRLFHLEGEALEELARSWTVDPHFGHPALFVEARESADGSSAPAYYVAANFLQRHVLPANPAGLGYPFDSRLWARLRKTHGGREPLLTAFSAPDSTQACPRCGGPISARSLADGVGEAIHGMPVRDNCALRAHLAVDPRYLPAPALLRPDAMVKGLESVHRSALVGWRLAAQVAEPADHLHGPF